MKRSTRIEIPAEILNIQKWFAGIVLNPLIEDRIDPISPEGMDIQIESARFILPSAHLKPHQRIEIYNQQYWWRLINILQANFPLTLRLFGPGTFNRIAVLFLKENPPNHWSLVFLGKIFPKWIKENYLSHDVELICHASELDSIFYMSAIESNKNCPRLRGQQLQELLNQNLYTQPHLFLIEYPYDLLAFREIVIKNDPLHWANIPFPNLDLDQICFAIFQNSKNKIAWKKLSSAEFFLLQQFMKGVSILTACEWIYKQEPILQKPIIDNFQEWIQSWIHLNWITLSRKKN